MLLRSYTSVNNGCVATGFVSPTRFVTPTRFATRLVSARRFVSRVTKRAEMPTQFVTHGRERHETFQQRTERLHTTVKKWLWLWQRQVCRCIRNARGLSCYDYTDRKTPNYVVCSLCVDRSIAALPSCFFSGEVPGPQWIPKLGSFCVSLWWVYCTVL